MRSSAKRVFFLEIDDPAVLDLVAERLRESYRAAKDAESEETAGWLINALGRAGGTEYADLLREVKQQASSGKVRSRAASVLARAERAERRSGAAAGR